MSSRNYSEKDEKWNKIFDFWPIKTTSYILVLPALIIIVPMFLLFWLYMKGYYKYHKL